MKPLLSSLALTAFLSVELAIAITLTALVVYALFRVVDWLLP